MSLHNIRENFPSLKRELHGKPVVYMDGPGGTQVPESVIEAIASYYRTSNANAHGSFITSHETDELVDRVRATLADFVGASSPNSISFGPNMTTLNFALSRAISRSIEPGDEIIVTDLDHASNIQPWVNLQERGAIVHHIPVMPNATLDMEALAGKINRKTRLVAVGLASNAVGTVNDVALIRQWTNEVGALLIVDAVHYAPHFSLDVQALDPDFLLCSAYKFYGPHVGVLYSKPGNLDRLRTDRLPPAPADAPGKIETGTLNFAALAGAAAAVDFIASLSPSTSTKREQIMQSMRKLHEQEQQLSQRLYHGLSSIAGVKVYGIPVGSGLRTPTVSFTKEGFRSPDIAAVLGEQGIFLWGGHFYAPILIERLGTEPMGGVVRVGLSAYNTAEEVERLLEAVTKL